MEKSYSQGFLQDGRGSGEPINKTGSRQKIGSAIHNLKNLWTVPKASTIVNVSLLSTKWNFDFRREYYLQSLHKSLRSTLGDGSQVIDKICLGHTNPSVDDRQGVVISVGDKLNLEFFSAVKPRRVRQTLVANFVQSLNETEFKVRRVIPENC